MCPPGTDQTTRSPQRWTLVVPARAGKIHLLDGWGNDNKFRTMHELLKAMSSSQAFEFMVRPTKSFISNSAGSRNHQVSSLETLPAELLAMVLSDSALSRDDVANFGVCSKTIWMHVLGHIYADCRRSAGAWAGTPLICTGTYLTDLPPALLKLYPEVEEQQRRWDSRFTTKKKHFLAPYHGVCPARQWNWGVVDSRITDTPDVKSEWKRAVSNAVRSPRTAPYSSQLMTELDQVVRFHHKPVTGQWMLRNLTQQEYVKLDVVEKSDGNIHATVSGTPGLTLDKALLLRICWTDVSDALTDDPEHGKWLRGEWAGHCFEVVQVAGMPREGWKDVTNAFIAHATANGFNCEPFDAVKSLVGLFASAPSDDSGVDDSRRD